jgi:hypothetical protein
MGHAEWKENMLLLVSKKKEVRRERRDVASTYLQGS